MPEPLLYDLRMHTLLHEAGGVEVSQQVGAERLKSDLAARIFHRAAVRIGTVEVAAVVVNHEVGADAFAQMIPKIT